MLFDNVYIEQKQTNGDILLVKSKLYLADYTWKRQSNGDILLKKVTIVTPDNIDKWNFKGAKIQQAVFKDGTTLTNPSFKKLYEIVHEQIGDGAQIIKHSILNIKTIEDTEKGFNWYPDLGISVQGVDANKAMKEVVTQCQKNNLEITILNGDQIIKINI